MNKEPGKQYGLILQKKGAQDVIQRPSIFDEGSESGDSDKGDGNWKKKAFQREGTTSVVKQQAKSQIKKALSQDPSIYSYDEIYDDMKDKVSSAAPVKKDEKKTSRYIQSLKRNAEKRKLDNERRLEREVQKERQLEGEQFKDKETFVTSSYKKKLEEFKQMDDEEKRIDRLEDIGDVTKQKDISGFYRHLYRTTVDVVQTGEQKDSVKDEQREKAEPNVKAESNVKSLANKSSKAVETNEKNKKRRQYRQRRKSGSSKEEGENTSSSQSSSSSSSSSSENESEGERKSKLRKEDKSRPKSNTPENDNAVAPHCKENDNLPLKLKDDELKPNRLIIDGTEKVVAKVILKDSKNVAEVVENIWLKRTVGLTFAEAQKRYFERKENRQGSY